MLNKTPVLDKGIVALASSSLDDASFSSLQNELNDVYLDVEKFEEAANAVFYFKCPLFIQLHISKFNLRVIQLPVNGEPEAYMPDVSVINTGNNSTDRDISQDIEATTSALLINPKAYQHDGCDRFISQTISPISVYNSIVVSGSVAEWKKFIADNRLPFPVEQYRFAVQEIMKAGWRHLGNGTQEDQKEGEEQ